MTISNGRTTAERLRVAIIAGNLGQAGAEKQLVYIARALRDAGAEVRVYYMRPGEFYEPVLRDLGFWMMCLGRWHPLIRLAKLTLEMLKFSPHVVHSGHFWTNIYAGLAGRPSRSLIVGGMRITLAHDLNLFRSWAPVMLHVPPLLLANSYCAQQETLEYGLPPGKTRVLHNVIDLAEFDHKASQPVEPLLVPRGAVTAAAIGRMVVPKRFDRFMNALALARRRVPELVGILIGDGVEEANLRKCAANLGLLPDGLHFLGRRNDVPALLKRVDMLVSSSDHEGFANVILEAMTAGLPVVATPSGDSGRIVQDGITGYVVPFDDVEILADRMVRLAQSEPLRQQFGSAARQRVEQEYAFEGLSRRILSLYLDMARYRRHRRSLAVLQRQTEMQNLPPSVV